MNYTMCERSFRECVYHSIRLALWPLFGFDWNHAWRLEVETTADKDDERFFFIEANLRRDGDQKPITKKVRCEYADNAELLQLPSRLARGFYLNLLQQEKR